MLNVIEIDAVVNSPLHYAADKVPDLDPAAQKYPYTDEVPKLRCPWTLELNCIG